ncbi:DNA-binding transcriptional LysR family regulator [Palleronia aestuarii]|uniref:DNA-binding transcriptional LysR family regulator n=1 Tax=Palleronia aestuarii TaxID=568105 RepID=A0A2W7NJX6_9RHOB|nr:LysR family transcriptional regulator [Palleronia aestuarii]PZX17004.1 DNA-binding transcriptional LysR family regulator [Palleronia aestuarii]
MRLEWLEDILAVAETGSFSEAAERRHLTQSAFSRRIRHIEEYLGIELFDRSRKPVQLRDTLLEQREPIAELARQLRQLTEDLRHGDRVAGNRIVLASQHSLTASLTPKLVRRLEASHVNIHVRLRSANLDGCYAMLLSRSADVAIVYFLADEGIEAQPDYIETAEIGYDRLIPVAGTQIVRRLNDATDAPLPLIAYPGEVFFGRVLDRAILPAVRAYRTVAPKVETALTHAALELASEGIGIAWVPMSLAAARLDEGRIADLSDRLPGCRLGVAALRIRGTPSPAAASVWAQLMAERCSMQPSHPDAPGEGREAQR